MEAFNSTCKLTKCNQKMVQMVLADYKIFNAEVLERNIPSNMIFFSGNTTGNHCKSDYEKLYIPK